MPKQNSFYSESKFYPDQHFPYGLSRSGDFNLFQAALLEKHGKAYEALHFGRREPVNGEEARFISVCRGELPPQTEHEKVWLYFCEKIERKPPVSAFGHTYRQPLREEMETDSTVAEAWDD
ncbi:MAG TPA: hypothetical protein DCZ03_01285 [Gammaproteobacteria bacterium]|nr:hypothetical protein [Gammaproteobacteria bacterium]